MNPGGPRADLLRDNRSAGEAVGEMTYAEAAVVQPFADTLFTLTLTGAEVKQVLEEQYQPEGRRGRSWRSASQRASATSSTTMRRAARASTASRSTASRSTRPPATAS